MFFATSVMFNIVFGFIVDPLSFAIIILYTVVD